MPLKFLNDVGVRFDRRRAQRALRLLDEYVQTSAVASKDEYVVQLKFQIEVFINSLGRPISTGTIFDHRSRPTVESANKVWGDLTEDIGYIYDLYKQLTEFTQSSFNYISGVHGNIQGTIANVAVRAVDASLAFGVPQKAVFVAGDSFQTDSLIETGSTVERPFASAGVTLGRTSSDRLGPERFNMSVFFNDVSFTDSDGRFAVAPPFEGFLYAPFGQARPEGGIFRFQQVAPEAARTTKGVQTVKSVTRSQSIFEKVGTALNKALGGAAGVGAVGFIAGGVGGALLGLGLSTIGAKRGQPKAGSLDRNIIKPSDIFTILAPTTESDLLRERERMFDDDAATFWEIEQSIQMVPEDVDDVLDPDTAETSQSKIEEFEQAHPDISLDAVIVLEFNDFEDVNWIHLNPVHFTPRSHVEVTNIEFSDDNENFTKLPGFDSNTAANILTEQANSHLGEAQQGVTLEKNKFEFSGQGLWVFPSISARFIRIHLRNINSYVAPYDVYAYQMVKKSTKKRGKTKVLGVTVRGSKTTKTVQTETIRLNYLEGLSIFEGNRDLRESTGETPGSSAEDPGFSANVVGIPLFSSGGTSSSSTGWYVGETWQEIRTDIFRFGMGIRELGIFQNTYMEESELISVPFSTPLPIKTLQLHVDEKIPADFDRTEAWIGYFVSVDDGSTWVPISPVGSTLARSSEGERIPQIIELNTKVPEGTRDPRRTYVQVGESVQSVRFKAVVRRPSNEPNTTPSLNWYRLVMTTVETFDGFQI